jgi:predicted Zn-dependent peptidase
VTVDELERVRQIYFYELDFSRDSCFEMQIRYGWGELMDIVRDIEDDSRQAAALTTDTLRRVAVALFKPDNLNLVVVGAWGEKEKKAVLAEMDSYAAAWETTLSS